MAKAEPNFKITQEDIEKANKALGSMSASEVTDLIRKSIYSYFGIPSSLLQGSMSNLVASTPNGSSFNQAYYKSWKVGNMATIHQKAVHGVDWGMYPDEHEPKKEIPQQTLYTILELQPICSQSDIKKSYRQLAKKLHPDKNNGIQSDKWDAVQNAYRVLSGEKSRKRYDLLLGAISGKRKPEIDYDSTYKNYSNPKNYSKPSTLGQILIKSIGHHGVGRAIQLPPPIAIGNTTMYIYSAVVNFNQRSIYQLGSRVPVGAINGMVEAQLSARILGIPRWNRADLLLGIHAALGLEANHRVAVRNITFSPSEDRPTYYEVEFTITEH